MTKRKLIIAQKIDKIKKGVSKVRVWEDYVDSLCKRVSSGLAALKQPHQDVRQDTLLTIYNAIIEPLFDYCDVVW